MIPKELNGAKQIERGIKPLGGPSYGSIPHLPGSRLGPGEKCINEGQERIATIRKRDKHDLIIVQEKIDGSNVGVAKVGGKIIALTRAGYEASTSPYVQHHLFAEYVRQNESRFFNLLNEGERVCGEWLAQAHGTRYLLKHEPFVAFDIMTGSERLPVNVFSERVWKYDFIIPWVIHYDGPMSIKSAMDILSISGHGAIDPVEGAVWRVERKGKVDFLCKYVRLDKQDGKYFPELTGNGEVWNIDITPYLK